MFDYIETLFSIFLESVCSGIAVFSFTSIIVYSEINRIPREFISRAGRLFAYLVTCFMCVAVWPSFVCAFMLSGYANIFSSFEMFFIFVLKTFMIHGIALIIDEFTKK